MENLTVTLTEEEWAIVVMLMYDGKSWLDEFWEERDELTDYDRLGAKRRAAKKVIRKLNGILESKRNEKK